MKRGSRRLSDPALLALCDGHNDLPDLFVRFEIPMCVNDGLERKTLRDDRCERSVLETIENKAFPLSEALRITDDFVKNESAKRQTFLHCRHERKGRRALREPAVEEDDPANARCLRKLLDDRTCDRIKRYARAFFAGDAGDFVDKRLFVAHDDVRSTGARDLITLRTRSRHGD